VIPCAVPALVRHTPPIINRELRLWKHDRSGFEPIYSCTITSGLRSE